MSGRERLFLKMRNKGGQGQADEIFCTHYVKRLRGYLTFLFLRLQSVGLFVMCAVMSVASVFIYPTDDGILRALPIAFAAITGFFWLCMIFKGLWYWKYNKHVFVTDEGIWVTGCSTFWWRGARDFMGKRKLLAAYWSLYSWTELKSVGAAAERGKSASRISDFFDGFDNAVVKLTKLPSVFMKRWDGVERIDFLSSSDAQALIDCAKSQKRAKRKKPESKESGSDEE